MDLRVNAGRAAKERLIDNRLADAATAAPSDQMATRLQALMVFPSHVAQCRSRERVKKTLGDMVQDRPLQRLDHVANETLDSGSRFGGHGIHRRGAGAPLFRATIQWVRA